MKPSSDFPHIWIIWLFIHLFSSLLTDSSADGSDIFRTWSLKTAAQSKLPVAGYWGHSGFLLLTLGPKKILKPRLHAVCLSPGASLEADPNGEANVKNAEQEQNSLPLFSGSFTNGSTREDATKLSAALTCRFFVAFHP